jgi:hypothetical protein
LSVIHTVRSCRSRSLPKEPPPIRLAPLELQLLNTKFAYHSGSSLQEKLSVGLNQQLLPIRALACRLFYSHVPFSHAWLSGYPTTLLRSPPLTTHFFFCLPFHHSCTYPFTCLDALWSNQLHLWAIIPPVLEPSAPHIETPPPPPPCQGTCPAPQGLRPSSAAIRLAMLPPCGVRLFPASHPQPANWRRRPGQIHSRSTECTSKRVGGEADQQGAR